MMLCLNDSEHEVAKFKTFGQRPGNCHVSGVYDESNIEHDMGYEGIPFFSAEAALTSILGRKAEENISCVNALVKCRAHAFSICCDSIVVYESCVREAEEFSWRERRMQLIGAGLG